MTSPGQHHFSGKERHMGVLMNLIDKTEEFLGHSPYPAIVGLPIGA
jgi:hypothetical protein